MKNHTKVYLEGMKIPITMYADDLGLICEWCEAGPMVDVNHIYARGMGGSTLKDSIENLIGLCRHCHLQFESHKIDREAMSQKHLKNIP